MGKSTVAPRTAVIAIAIAACVGPSCKSDDKGAGGAANRRVAVSVTGVLTGTTHTRKALLGPGGKTWKAGEGKKFVVVGAELVHHRCDPAPAKSANPQGPNPNAARVTTKAASLEIGGATYGAVGGSAFKTNVCIDCNINYGVPCDGKKPARAWFAFKVDAEADLKSAIFKYRGEKVPLAGIAAEKLE